MELSIIIPTKDRQPILYGTLQRAYEAISQIKAEIIVINDSKTSSVSVPLGMQDKVRVLTNANSGVASARNLGANQAQGDLLLFMDDDMWISQENILITLDLHRQHHEKCIILNWVYPPELSAEIRQTQFGRYLMHYGFTTMKGWNRGQVWSDIDFFACKGITSQYLSLKKNDFIRSGGYNENFPFAGFEDYDFGRALAKINVIPYVFPQSIVYHNEADRTQLKPWLDRKKRGGITRRVAVEMGYTELAISHGKFKRVVYKMLLQYKNGLFIILSGIPNHRLLDWVYFRFVNILLGTSIFEGYTAGNSSHQQG
jgi:glycosyltransferase involved in cell wall biosynthesis